MYDQTEQAQLARETLAAIREQNELLREQNERSRRQTEVLEEMNHGISVLRTVINANHETSEDRATNRHRDTESALVNIRNAVSNLR